MRRMAVAAASVALLSLIALFILTAGAWGVLALAISGPQGESLRRRLRPPSVRQRWRRWWLWPFAAGAGVHSPPS